MKSILKKSVCYLMAITMLSISVTSSVFAADTVVVETSGDLLICDREVDELNKKLEEMNYSEIKEFLKKEFNATDQQASILAQYQMDSMAQVMKFPSKPKMGDKHKETYVIDVGIGAAVTDLATAIIVKSGKKYIKLAEALSIASSIMNLGSAAIGHKVKVTVEYRYGYTNDGVLGWTPGHSTYKVIK